MDLALFNFFHGFAGQAPWLDWLIIFFAEYVPYLIIVSVIAAAFRSSTSRYILALFSAFLAKGIVTVIRLFYHHPRPSAVLDITSLFSEISYSFPSAHAMFFFALATGVYLTNKTFGCILFVLAVLMGFARIAAGVHWPSDIAGGAVLGTVLSILIFNLCQKSKQK